MWFSLMGVEDRLLVEVERHTSSMLLWEKIFLTKKFN